MPRTYQHWKLWHMGAIVAYLLAVLVCGGGALAWQRTWRNLAPPGAIDVHVEWSQPLRPYVTYHIPPGWLLIDLYAYLEECGWARDRMTEHAIERDGMEAAALAVFTQPGWFGLENEMAIVRSAPDHHKRVQVQLILCSPARLWMRCG